MRERIPWLCLPAALLVALGLMPVAAASGRAGGILSTRLAELAAPALSSASHAEQGRALSLAPAGAGSLLRRGNRVVVEARFDSGALDAAKLHAAGADVLDVSGPLRTATVAVAPQRLHALAGVPGVEAVTEVLTPMVAAAEAPGSATSAYVQCSGAATTEGDTQLHALEARQTYDVDGTGSTVGILSDSFNTDTSASTSAADDVASGDLPGPGNPCGRTSPVNVLEDLNYNGDADEGRGMAQIVHDLAPGAKLAFATAFTSEIGFAQNIERLAKPVGEGGAGADVIADDVAYFNEPMFQEGPIAVAAGNVTAGGASYYSAAGNDNLIDASGRDIASWEAPSFRDASSCPADLNASAASERCMDFNPGAGSDSTFGITVSAGWTLTVDLQWAEPWNGVSTDIDAWLLDSSGKRIKEKGIYVGGSEDNPGTSKKPVEVFQWTNSAGSAREVQLAIVRCFGECNPGAASDTAPRLKFALLQNGGGVTATEYPQSSEGDVVGPTIFGHAGAQSVVGAGAIAYNSTTQPEEYSSRGPVTHYFGPVEGSGAAPPLGSPQTLGKPNVTATDGGANTFFGSLIARTWRFYGTSAAAPHAAAVAALIRDADPLATPAQISAALAKTADPIGAYGTNAIGAGLVNAKNAVGEFAEEPPDTTPPNTTITSGPEGATNDPTPTFTFSSNEEPASFECSLDEASFGPCTSPHTTATLPDGPHVFEVRATDAAENTDESPARSEFTVDTEAPGAPTLTATDPASPANDSEPLVLGQAEPGSTVRLYTTTDCSATEAAAGTATEFESPGLEVTVPDNSTTTFRATAEDPAGNVSPCSSPLEYLEDSQAPDTTIDSAPPSLTNADSASFEFSGSDPGGSGIASFECRLDSTEAGDWEACTSPEAFTGLPDGSHVFEVRAIDEAGNTDTEPASAEWTLDTTDPSSAASSTPLTNSTSITVDYTAADAGSGLASVELWVKPPGAPGFNNVEADSSPGASGSFNYSATEGDGTYAFYTRAKDQAGNYEAAPGSPDSSTVLDTEAPDTTIDEGPTGTTNDPTPEFVFTSSESGSSFECSLDEASFGPCTSPHTTATLPDGPHVFEVRATDEAGNTDESPARSEFSVDTTVPPEGEPPQPPSSITLPVPEVFPPDQVPPKVGLSVPKSQGAGGLLKVAVSCDEDCRVVATGRVILRKRGHRRRVARAARLGRMRLGLRKVARRLPAGRTATLAMRPRSRKAARRMYRLVRAGWLARATIAIKCVDSTGNVTKRRVAIRLRPPGRN